MAAHCLAMKNTSLAWLNTALHDLPDPISPQLIPVTLLQPPCPRTFALPAPFPGTHFPFLSMASPRSSSRSLLTHYPVTKALSVLSSHFVFAKALVSISY